MKELSQLPRAQLCVLAQNVQEPTRKREIREELIVQALNSNNNPNLPKNDAKSQ